MSDGAERWQRLEEVVQAALERPTSERAAFLADVCADDEDLRREAASLIDRDARAEGFLATPIGELAANAISRDFIGQRIGAHEIRARLGAGGMGEVYRAHDHSLHRDVAIKVLPAAFSADRERLARFEREARLLASLNHPHIGAVYGLEGSGDRRAIVLELIDGETLETRVKRGPLPGAQALTFAVQIADALDHAHRRGVTHRDLKPANIMLTKAGVKLLDFGLAKWTQAPRGYVGLTKKPEGMESLTSEGTILGTVHYMAPEQLEGRDVDARADVFAFGAVLYEILTGRKAFDGGSAPAVIAAVLNTEPAALDTIQRLSSPSFERIIRKCLAKDPDDRWQTTRDLADALKWLVEEATRAVDHSGSDAAIGTAVGGRTLGVGRAAALVVIATALAGWAGWSLAPSRESPASKAITRFAVQPSAAPLINGFDISPDGTTLVYAGGQLGAIRLFIRRLDQFGDSPVAGTEGAFWPSFSRDGQWVAYISGNRLLKVNLQTAAAPIVLCAGIEQFLPNGVAWAADGSIILARPELGLQRVSAEGGEPVPLTSLSQTPREFDHHTPSLLPGGQTVLFTVHDSAGRFHVVVETLATAERKVVIESAYDARYLPSGHLVFARNQAILAVPFDLPRLEVTGPAVTLVEPVGADVVNGYGGYRLSANGTLVFESAPSFDGRTLTWVDRTGAETPLPISPRAFGSPRVSPDGSRVAFAIAERNRRDIWIYDFATERLTPVTREGDNRTPLWSRDGQRLTYSSMRGNAWQLFWQPADGSGAPERLVAGEFSLVPGSWSADGRVLVYTDGDTGPAGSHIFALPLDGERKSRRLLQGPAQERQPSLSPDGRWLAFSSTERPRQQVFVSDFPGFGSRHQVSIEGGREPMWSRDGREIVYRFQGRMFAVPVDTTRGFSAGKPRMLFDGRYVVGGTDVVGLDYDLAPDGRFLMIKPGPNEQAPPEFRVVLNWVDELTRRVPKAQ